MGILIFLIVCLFIGFTMAMPVALLIIKSRSQAKVKAKRILEEGKITNIQEFNHICKILSAIPNDLEASDLWKQLRELKAGVKS